MNYVFNELSLHGQYHSAADFVASVDRVMKIRAEIRRSGRELYCHRELAERLVTQEMRMPQIVSQMPMEKRLGWLQWITKGGPYWSDERLHSSDDYLELKSGEIVTDTGLGDAGFCKLGGLDREVVSFEPSDWLTCPLTVYWRMEDERTSVELENHWDLHTVLQSLGRLPVPVHSWGTLEKFAKMRFKVLRFSDEAFVPLRGEPFMQWVADRFLILFDVLDKMCSAFDIEGNRTSEGDRLYAKHFVGKKAWFTDSSDSEKVEFENELTFQHPTKQGQQILCGWHGKVKTPQFRAHFTWPIAKDVPVYVVYVGPKITKR